MSSFININNKEEITEAKYSANVIRKALLISETKSSIKADKLTKNIDAPISLNEALVLFSDKLNAMRHLTKLSLVESEEVSQELNNNITELELNEGAMSEIHRLAQEAKDVVDFTKKFFKEFGDKIKKSTESTEWVQELYNDVVSESKLEEGKSIGKIQKEYGQVVKDMITTVEEWKTAEGDRKKELLEKLRSLTAQKKQLSSDLDDAVGIKDLNVELAESLVTEAKFKKGQYIKSKNDSDDFDGDVYDRTNDVDGSEILKNSSFEIYEIGKDEVILWSDEDEVEYSIDPDDLKNFVKESVVTEHHSENPNDKYEVRPCDKPETPYGVWEGDTLVKCFELEQDAEAFAKEQNKEQGLDESFSRMSSDTIGNELFAASQALTTYYEWLKAGNDSGKGESIDHVISLLKKCKSNIKRFKTKEETIGTAYEAPLVEGLAECITEGNAFLAARAKAIEEDAEEFEFNGKKFPVIKESLTEQSDDALILIQQALKGMKNMKAKIKGDTVIISNKAKDEFTYSLNDGGDVQEFIDELEESLVNEKDDAGTHLDNLADLVGNAKSFMNVGKELKAGNYKYDFSTGMMPHYQVEADGFTFMIVNKRYVDKGDREVNNIAIGLLESVSEQSDDVATVTLDSLVEKFEVVAEAKFNKNSLMKAMKADDGMIQLGTGEEYVIYAYGNGNDNNDDMWGDKTIFALDQDGEEHEIEYSDIVSYNESVVTEKFNFSKKEVEAAANLIASAISQADKVKAKVHDLEYDKGRGAGFEISIDGEKYEGGSYVVKDNGDVVNAAIGNSHPNAVYNTIGNKDIADVFINMEKYESVTNEDIRGDVKRFIKDNKDSLNDLADQDLWEEMYQKLYDEFGVEADTIKAKDLLKTFQFVF